MRTAAKSSRNEDRQPPLLREILLSFWKIHILHHAGEEPVYGQWMMAELRRHGYEISPGTLYPILRRMEQQGWLAEARKKKGDPARRKQYRLTPQGKAALKTLCSQLEELYREVSPARRGGSDGNRDRYY